MALIIKFWEMRWLLITAALLSHGIVFAQEYNQNDSLVLDRMKSTDTSFLALPMDTVVKRYDILNSDQNAVVIPGKELLPLSSKRKRFAYFDTTHSYQRIITNNAFDVGESLIFTIRYGPVVAGSATMSIPELVEIKDRECYRIVTEARSSNFFSTIFKVEDRVESLMDRNGLYSSGFHKNLQEGKYRVQQSVEYDHIKRIAITDKIDTMRIPPCVQDVLTAFYYIRVLPLEVGKSVFIDNHADRRLYPLEIKVHRKERIKIHAGKFNCIIIEPLLRTDAIFKQRGRLLIWLTDDSRRIPVQMKSKVLIGSITAELKKMKGVLPIHEHVKL